MYEITFLVIPGEEDEGGYTAWWDDEPGRGGITTEGETLDHLQAMVAEAVEAYFEDEEQRPSVIKLHFIKDPVVVA